jgi:hypothetical protein
VLHEALSAGALQAWGWRVPFVVGGAAGVVSLSSSSYLRFSYSSGGLYGEVYERAYMIRCFPQVGGAAGLSVHLLRASTVDGYERVARGLVCPFVRKPFGHCLSTSFTHPLI